MVRPSPAHSARAMRHAKGRGRRTGVRSGVGRFQSPFCCLLCVAGALGAGVVPTTGPPMRKPAGSEVGFFRFLYRKRKLRLKPRFQKSWFQSQFLICGQKRPKNDPFRKVTDLTSLVKNMSRFV